MQRKAFSAYNESSKRFLSRALPVVDSAREPIKVLKILMEGPAPEDLDGLWLINFRGVPVARSHNPFDLAYLDQDNRILQAVEITQTSRFVPFKGQPASALILPPRSLSRTQSFTGDRIQFTEVEVEAETPDLAQTQTSNNLFSRIVRATMVKTFNVPDAPGQAGMHSGPLMRNANLSIRPPAPTKDELEHERLAARVAAATADGPVPAPAQPQGVLPVEHTEPPAAIPSPAVTSASEEPETPQSAALHTPQPSAGSSEPPSAPPRPAPPSGSEPAPRASTSRFRKSTEWPPRIVPSEPESIASEPVTVPQLPAVEKQPIQAETPPLAAIAAVPTEEIKHPAPAPIFEAPSSVTVPAPLDLATQPAEPPAEELQPSISDAEATIPPPAEASPVEAAPVLPPIEAVPVFKPPPAPVASPAIDAQERSTSDEKPEPSPTAKLVAALASAAARTDANDSATGVDELALANPLYDIEPISLPDEETAAELEKTMPLARDVAALISANVEQASELPFVVLASERSIIYAKEVPAEQVEEDEEEETEESDQLEETAQWDDEKLLAPSDLARTLKSAPAEDEPQSLRDSTNAPQTVPAPEPEPTPKPSSRSAQPVQASSSSSPKPAPSEEPAPSPVRAHTTDDSYTMRLVGEPVRSTNAAQSDAFPPPERLAPSVAPRSRPVPSPKPATSAPRQTVVPGEPPAVRPVAPPEPLEPPAPRATHVPQSVPAEEPNSMYLATAPAPKTSEEEKQRSLKLTKRWDVKLLYSVFPDLHPDFRPDLETPEVNFKKDVGLMGADKQSRKLQILNWLYPDLHLDTVKRRQRQHRRAPRIPVPGLVGYFFTGGAACPQEIRNISVMGFYMKTDQRWMPGTVIRITLQMIDSDGQNPSDSITVLARAVNWDRDGGGFEFVLPGLID